MKPINVAIIEDKQSDFFRLQEQIRARAEGVGKIYSCGFHREFLELLNEKELGLVISENEIGGRPNVGLDFFHRFYNEPKNSKIYSIIYTWGTYDYQNFRIRVHSLNQRHSNFLGAIFKQIGDYDKIIEIINAILQSRPYPLFDQPLVSGARKRLKQGQRQDAERLIDLHHRIEEPLRSIVQIVRYHLEHRPSTDFVQTLQEFPEVRERFLSKLNALSDDVTNLQILARPVQANSIQRLSDTSGNAQFGQLDLSSLNHLTSVLRLLLRDSTADVCLLPSEGPEVLLHKVLKNYESFSRSVARLMMVIARADM